MRAVRRLLALAVCAAAPAHAVGLGPLSVEGVIDGPNRGFSLTLLNPYQEPVTFRAYAVGAEDELPQVRVGVYPPEVTLGPGLSRRVLIIANDLQPGETYKFRVCAERAHAPEGALINARVCSKLSARRIG